MPQCEFYTAKFTRCTRGCDTHYCRTHAPKAEALGPRPAEGHCLCVRYVQGADQWCGQLNREGESLCQWHWQRVETRAADQQRRAERAAMEEVTLYAYLDQNPRQTWDIVARHLWMRMRLPRTDPAALRDDIAYTVARRYFLRTTPETVPVLDFTTYWALLWEEEQGILRRAADPPLGQMGRLAADTQNVHTAVVSKQTNSNVELLLEVTPLVGVDTLATLTKWWMLETPQAFEDYWRVMEDVRHWYEKRTCKSTGDFLYKRVLNGLVAKLTTMEGEVFAELVKRLWEECEEAVGMCCEGHISRLANVLVGFDETFRPPVPVGEILQTKMAAIAELKLSPKLKLQKAVAVMDELNIPVDERAPWLEALEE